MSVPVVEAERNAGVVAAKGTRHIPSLDGIRAVSFLLVFVAHAGLDRWVPGGLGVTVFFFLSGFLITTLMRVELEKNGFVNLRHFWLRRALRILPPFYLVLAATSFAALIFDPPRTLSVGAVTALALHFNNYWTIWHGYEGQPAGVGVYWSLAVEEHFYLLFPWLYLGMQRLHLSRHRQALVLWGLCLLVLLWRFVLVLAMHATSDRTYMASDTRIDSILFGCALAVWNNPVVYAPPLVENRWKYLVVPAAVAVLVACLLYRAPVFRETVRYSVQGIALTFIFIAAIRFNRWLPFRLLNLRPIAFVGVLSYSLYLLHYAVIFAVRRCVSGASLTLQGALALTISCILAWIIFEVLEKPCARLRRRLTD